jgi:cobalt/nickel transport system permease protein
MHISEGVLSVPILISGAALTAAGVTIGLRKMRNDTLVTVAILSAAFFVGSLVHIPVGPSSAHLILNGLLGAVLGWASFPAILVGLLLQAVSSSTGAHRTRGQLFQHGRSGRGLWRVLRPAFAAKRPRPSHRGFFVRVALGPVVLAAYRNGLEPHRRRILSGRRDSCGGAHSGDAR